MAICMKRHDPTKSAQPVADQLLRAKLREVGRRGGQATTRSPKAKGFDTASAQKASRRRWDGLASVDQARQHLKRPMLIARENGRRDAIVLIESYYNDSAGRSNKNKVEIFLLNDLLKQHPKDVVRW